VLINYFTNRSQVAIKKHEESLQVHLIIVITWCSYLFLFLISALCVTIGVN